MQKLLNLNFFTLNNLHIFQLPQKKQHCRVNRKMPPKRKIQHAYPVLDGISNLNSVSADTKVVYIGPKTEIKSGKVKKARLDELDAAKKAEQARLDELDAAKKAEQARLDELDAAKKAKKTRLDLLDEFSVSENTDCESLYIGGFIDPFSVNPEDDDPEDDNTEDDNTEDDNTEDDNTEAAAQAAALAAVYAEFQMLCDGGARAVDVAITGLASMGSDGQVDTACSVKPGQLK